MKHFINARTAIVTDALDGFLAASGPGLARLDDFPDVKVVLRSDWAKEGVAVISGGGSGHEPAHAGYVGKGMLTAAVCGEVFASPSVEAVLAALLAVTGDAGALLIVKNYTGDRLNFGLAAEQARARGLKVEMVIVGDDVALPDNPQPRGIAGTVLVHKLAGAAAAAGLPLPEVLAAARDAATHVRSLGLALTNGTGFGEAGPQRIAEGQAELGLGIHGEPGAATIQMGDAQTLVGRVVAPLLASLGPNPARQVLMLNNLGSVPPIEMSILAKAVLASELGPLVDQIVGPASLMTSLDMNGFSLSLLEASPARLEGLAAPTTASAWPGIRPWGAASLRPKPALERETAAPSANPALRAVIEKVLAMLESSEAEINALDGKVGDGDAGTTFALAGRAVSAHLDDLPLAEPGKLMLALVHLLERHAGGSSGVLLAILFAAAGTAYESAPDLGKALQAGLDKMMAYGGAKPGDRTMIDALAPAIGCLARGETLRAAADAARKGADETTRMAEARAGRASYIRAESLSGHIDPGAEIVARVFATLVAVAG
ncbi:homodimeric dihydroxyacetone kinase [Arboricoccus pini]|uniref:Homodimeric dihydroxyacetone kinase n=1 Tax=Arboricoccus pini TaxID=1963835 RepID=A0A212S142_9PROT|nr:dihydroxyacetone kinase subunit DhaK [Arboricoccus pini]SNB78704.1 homodimeric dihydroxyacetone kinase [Arboricoccus pini]